MMIDTVAASVEEQSVTTKEIADVNNSSHSMSGNSQKVSKDSEGLNILSEELSKTVEQFIIDGFL